MIVTVARRRCPGRKGGVLRRGRPPVCSQRIPAWPGTRWAHFHLPDVSLAPLSLSPLRNLWLNRLFQHLFFLFSGVTPAKIWIGLEHVNKAPKKSRYSYLEKAIKIHNWPPRLHSPAPRFSPRSLDVFILFFWFKPVRTKYHASTLFFFRCSELSWLVLSLQRVVLQSLEPVFFKYRRRRGRVPVFLPVFFFWKLLQLLWSIPWFDLTLNPSPRPFLAVIISFFFVCFLLYWNMVPWLW